MVRLSCDRDQDIILRDQNDSYRPGERKGPRNLRLAHIRIGLSLEALRVCRRRDRDTAAGTFWSKGLKQMCERAVLPDEPGSDSIPVF